MRILSPSAAAEQPRQSELHLWQHQAREAARHDDTVITVAFRRKRRAHPSRTPLVRLCLMLLALPRNRVPASGNVARLHVADLAIDALDRRITQGTRELRLSPSEHVLLYTLAANRGTVVRYPVWQRFRGSARDPNQLRRPAHHDPAPEARGLAGASSIHRDGHRRRLPIHRLADDRGLGQDYPAAVAAPGCNLSKADAASSMIEPGISSESV
jgi:hypothetical protein